MPDGRLLRRAAILVALALPLAPACSSDDGEGASAEFCDTLEGMNEIENPTNSEAFELIDKLQEEAPDDIADDVDTMVGFLRDVEDFEENDPEALNRLTALLQNDDFTEAANNIEAYASDECGIDTDPTG